MSYFDPYILAKMRKMSYFDPYFSSKLGKMYSFVPLFLTLVAFRVDGRWGASLSETWPSTPPVAAMLNLLKGLWFDDELYKFHHWFHMIYSLIIQ